MKKKQPTTLCLILKGVIERKLNAVWFNFSGTFYFFMLLSFLYNIFNFYGEGYPAIG